jgi:RNA polymerase sigma factor (sigma-70 family)
VSTASDDTARFEALFREHYPAVLRFGLRRAPTAVAEDVAAETFAAAWRSLGSVPADPLPWLLAVARRRLASQYRDSASQRAKAAHSERVGPVAARDHAEGVRERQAIAAAFAALSDPDREVLRLIAWDGLSAADAAQVLGVSVLAFRARASRARRRLARGLAVHEAPPVHRRIPEAQP